MNTTKDTHFKFDGYVQAPQGPRVPCDVQLWLPKGPSEDAAISVFLNGDAEAVMGRGGVRITSNERVEAQGLRFVAEDVLIRSSKAQPGFRQGGSQLTITHVGKWVIHHVRTRPDAPEDALEYFKVSLSALKYGAQPSSPTVTYLGERKVKTHGPANRLRFVSTPKAATTWELQKHWEWESNKDDDSLSAQATAALCLVDSATAKVADLPRLRDCAEDTCLLLTLAARHSTAPHVVSYLSTAGSIQEWRYPLERLRSRTEEEATGPLIAQDELESFFERASTWWSSLDHERKDAVRLAVFAVHGITSQTLESTLMSRFAALEGLAKRWGDGDTAGKKFRDMLERFPAASAGLWPMYDKAGGVPLYWFRNEIAHGRTVMRFGEGLSLASDHLQLWLERVLLGLMGYHRTNRSDWLSRQVIAEQSEVARVRAELAARSGAAAS
jgi:hypothetical protein